MRTYRERRQLLSVGNTPKIYDRREGLTFQCLIRAPFLDLIPQRVIRHFAPLTIRKRTPIEEYGNIERYFTNRMRMWLAKVQDKKDEVVM